jgi:hypothetical protein
VKGERGGRKGEEERDWKMEEWLGERSGETLKPDSVISVRRAGLFFFDHFRLLMTPPGSRWFYNICSFEMAASREL